VFKDRKEAGRLLAQALKKYSNNENVLVLAIPRGGVEVGYEIATGLNVDFSIIISRKLPFPDNPESGFGAIAEDGSLFIFDFAKASLASEEIDEIIKQQKEEIKRRIDVLRDGKDLAKITGKIIVLVDDGIAMGSTMYASIKLCKNKRAKKIIIASPVSSIGVEDQLKSMVDEVVILLKPKNFRAVAQAYENWYDVPDKEVVDLLKKYKMVKKNNSI